jgi:hypothetical protein
MFKRRRVKYIKKNICHLILIFFYIHLLKSVKSNLMKRLKLMYPVGLHAYAGYTIFPEKISASGKKIPFHNLFNICNCNSC